MNAPASPSGSAPASPPVPGSPPPPDSPPRSEDEGPSDARVLMLAAKPGERLFRVLEDPDPLRPLLAALAVLPAVLAAPRCRLDRVDPDWGMAWSGGDARRAVGGGRSGRLADGAIADGVRDRRGGAVLRPQLGWIHVARVGGVATDRRRRGHPPGGVRGAADGDEPHDRRGGRLRPADRRRGGVCGDCRLAVDSGRQARPATSRPPSAEPPPGRACCWPAGSPD